MEHVPRWAEAAVGTREVEAVVEADPGLGVRLEKLAFIHIWGGIEGMDGV